MNWRTIAYIVALVALLLWLTSMAGLRPWWLKDLREKLPVHGSLEYNRRSLEQITRVVIHHSGTSSDYTPEQIASYHVSAGNHICTTGCPGIAYHFLIANDGAGYQVNDLETVSYHVGDNNTASVGICLIGDYNILEPTTKQLSRVKQLIRYVEQKTGKKLEVVGHRDMRSTSCPGNNIDLAKLA